jgi:hypothetical protein
MNPSSSLTKIKQTMEANGILLKLKVSMLSNDQIQIKANLAR